MQEAVKKQEGVARARTSSDEDGAQENVNKEKEAGDTCNNATSSMHCLGDIGLSPKPSKNIIIEKDSEDCKASVGCKLFMKSKEGLKTDEKGVDAIIGEEGNEMMQGLARSEADARDPRAGRQVETE